MRILHLVSQDHGGAGRAALRLHRALLAAGVDSLMLVQDKQSDTKGVLRLAQTKPQKLIEKLRPALNQLPLMLYPKRHRDIFSPDGPSNGLLLRRIRALKPDLVHVHWVNNGFLSVGDLTKLELPMMCRR